MAMLRTCPNMMNGTLNPNFDNFDNFNFGIPNGCVHTLLATQLPCTQGSEPYMFPMVVHPRSIALLVYPTVVYARCISLLVYPTVVYGNSDIGLAYPTVVYTRSISLLAQTTALYVH